MGRKAKQLKNYTTEQAEALFERDENNRTGIKLYAILQISRGYRKRQSSQEGKYVHTTIFLPVFNP